MNTIIPVPTIIPVKEQSYQTIESVENTQTTLNPIVSGIIVYFVTIIVLFALYNIIKGTITCFKEGEKVYGLFSILVVIPIILIVEIMTIWAAFN